MAHQYEIKLSSLSSGSKQRGITIVGMECGCVMAFIGINSWGKLIFFLWKEIFLFIKKCIFLFYFFFACLSLFFVALLSLFVPKSPWSLCSQWFHEHSRCLLSANAAQGTDIVHTDANTQIVFIVTANVVYMFKMSLVFIALQCHAM